MGKDKKQADENSRVVCRNRRARYEYEIQEQIECGVVLRGSEVKSIRDGKVSLEEAYAKIKEGELWLVGCDIALYPQANIMNHEPRRERKLLLHRRELAKFAAAAQQQGLTLIPLSLYFSGGKVKLTVAVAKGRKLHDKREKMKKDTARDEIRRALSDRRR